MLNIRFFRLAWLVVIVIAITACSSETHVPSNYYAVVVRMGEIINVVNGPSLIDRNQYIETVVMFPKEQRVVFMASGNLPVPVTLEVLDPRKYYFATEGNAENLVSFYKSKLIMLPPDQVATFLVAELNKPDNGFRIKPAN